MLGVHLVLMAVVDESTCPKAGAMAEAGGVDGSIDQSYIMPGAGDGCA